MKVRLIRRSVTAVAAAVLCALPISAKAQQRQTAIENPAAAADYKSEPQGLFVEPELLERATIFGDRHFGNGPITNGFYVNSWNMVPGAGWITAGPGYRHWYAKDRLFVDTSAAISWRGYKTAQAHVELPRLLQSRLLLGSQVHWEDFTQVAYFGEGSAAPVSAVSEYRVKAADIVGYATLRAGESIDVDLQVGWLQPSVLPRAGLFKRDRPDTRLAFPRNIVYTLADQPPFIHTEAAVTVDTRDFPGHATRGGLVRAAAAHYADRDTNVFSFRRYEAEGARFMPLADSRVVVALHGWLVASDTGPGQFVPFYLQPSLGGHNTLRSYADYRFHDRHLALLNAEARIGLTTHLDGALFLDAGNVAARVRDLNLAKRSYGLGFRLHSRRQTYARLDLARGDEGWRVLLRLTDPLNFSRMSRRTAAVPFVP